MYLEPVILKHYLNLILNQVNNQKVFKKGYAVFIWNCSERNFRYIRNILYRAGLITYDKEYIYLKDYDK